MPLFGRPKASTAVDAKTSLDKLRETSEILDKREEHLRSKADAEVERARQLVAKKNKRDALRCLSRKRTYEAQADRISQTRFNLEKQAMTLEHTTMNVEAMDAMRDGAASMRAMQKNTTLDDVDGVLDDIQETMDVASEISDAISQPMGDMWSLDDDELLAELDGFEQNGMGEEFAEEKSQPEPTNTEQQPERTNTEPQPNNLADEEAEFALLESSMML